MSEPIPVLIRTLAPVHLGCDEVYEPLNFVIHPDRQELIAFDPGAFLDSLQEADRGRFLELCRKGTVASLLEIYQFFYQRREKARGRAVAVCPGLVTHYQEVMRLQVRGRELNRALNQFTIHRTAYLAADQRPYIPGSAVKGALRTAYLNALAKLKPLSTPKDHRGRWDPRALEQRFLNYHKIPEDPFRLLKVSDFLPVGEVRTRIVYAVNEKKKPPAKFPEARGPYQILEVIEPGAEFLGIISVTDLPPDWRRLARINHVFTLEELFQAARSFYPQEKQQEDDHLFELGIPRLPLTSDNGRVPLRLGRHSGAECVTLAGHRKIKILQAKGAPPQTKDHATTLWLAADFHQRDKRREAHLRPFGWVALEELGPEQARELAAQEEAWRREIRLTPVKPAPAPPEAPPAAAPEEPTPVPAPPATQVWEQATLTWSPGNQTLTAVYQGKKAHGKGRELVPEALQKRLLKDRRSVSARVTVEVEGNLFRVVKIETML